MKGLFVSILIAIWLGTYHVQAAAVFAHFMVTNSQNFTTYDWEANMVNAQQAHIDAFALNMAYADSTNEPSLVHAFEAAGVVGFQLFFSFDYAGNGPWPKSAVIDLLNQYGANEHYYRYKGKPFVSTFEGPGSASDWIDIKEQTGCYFVPDWSSVGAKAALEASPGVPDGLFSWAAWPWGPNDMDTYVDASYMQYLNGKPYMMPVSPWFYTDLPGYKKNWLWNGDRLWFDRWQQVMYLQPEWVEIISWNDYGESHYIGPLFDNAYAAFDIGEAPYNYAAGYLHDGWRAFLPYLIDLYKTGTATITREGVQVWNRGAPAAACTNNGTTGNTVSQFQIEFPPVDILQDRVFYSALLGSPAEVTVSIGGVVQQGSWSNAPDGGIGIYQGSVPFHGRTGQVTVTISRNGAVVISTDGISVDPTNCLLGIQNWNAWTLASFTDDPISATPELNIGEQVCVNGTGPMNFASLCGFSCSYGYCPVGACVCTAMGKQRALPKATGIKGYPLAGEDASYSGLCDFNCNYGHCDPAACGTSEVPLTIPTVSDFSPPACISGTGEGNLAGLCAFSCGFGFCPINACTCTGQGALVLPPPSQNVSGYAGTGLDARVYGPLCDFTCSHGYCPEGACATNPYGSPDGASPGQVGIKPLPCTSLTPTATFTLSAQCTDGVLLLPSSGPDASSNNIPAGSPAVCHEVCDFFRLLTGTCCGQGGNFTNPVEIPPGVVIPLGIPLYPGYQPNIPIVIPVPGGYDPDGVFGNPSPSSSTTSTAVAPLFTTAFTTTYTTQSTFPVTQTGQDGQLVTTTIITPIVTTATVITTSSSAAVGSHVTGSHESRTPRKTCRSIGPGISLTTFLPHVPLPSAITLPAGMCLPGVIPLKIPPHPLPNTDPPCYKKDCSPCGNGACAGDRSSSGSDTGSTNSSDPDDPEECTDPSEAPSQAQGTCGNGNFPLWDSDTGEISCELPLDEAQTQMSDCQKDATDNLNETLDEIDCYADTCGGELAKRGKTQCPQPDSYKPPGPNDKCDAIFHCDVDKWPNVCNNARSAMDKKNAASILTYTHRKNGLHNTAGWLQTHGLGKNEGGAQRNDRRVFKYPSKTVTRSGWGLMGCEVEEYPFGNSISATKQEANYYDRPTLRLIPQKENSNHGEEMRKFLQYLQKVQNIKQPVYCVEVSSGTGQALPTDYCISEWLTCENKCAQAYGPSFILVNDVLEGDAKAAAKAGYTNMQEWDLWFDDPAYPDRKWAHTLSWDPAGLALPNPVYQAVTSTLPPRFPPSFSVNKQEPSGPGQKIYIGEFPFGSWELEFVDREGKTRTVGTPKAVVPQPDGSHLIYDAPPSQKFPYRRKRDVSLNQTAERRSYESIHSFNASMVIGNELHEINGLSRRTDPSGISFLDSRVYTEVLGCRLDSEMEPCSDCDLLGGPAPIPAGAGRDEPTAISTSIASRPTTTTTAKAQSSTDSTSIPTSQPTNGVRLASFFLTVFESGSSWIYEWNILDVISGQTFDPCNTNPDIGASANTVSPNPDFPSADIGPFQSHGISGCIYTAGEDNTVGTMTCPGVNSITCQKDSGYNTAFDCVPAIMTYVFSCRW